MNDDGTGHLIDMDIVLINEQWKNGGFAWLWKPTNFADLDIILIHWCSFSWNRLDVKLPIGSCHSFIAMNCHQTSVGPRMLVGSGGQMPLYMMH